MTHHRSSHIAPCPISATASNVDRQSLSRACRDAWRVFVEQSNEWSRAELVLWSAGFYAPIARYASRATTCSFLEDATDFSTMDRRFAERMIVATRARLVETLESLGQPQARAELTRAVRDANMVSRCIDSYGQSVYLPTPASELLVDRLFALLGADLLNQPADFDRKPLCAECGRVTAGSFMCCYRAEPVRHGGKVVSVQPATLRFDLEAKLAAGF